MANEARAFLERTIPNISAAAGGNSDAIEIRENSAMVIQQVGDATGTASIMVSARDDQYTEYHPSTTVYDFASPVVIQAGFMPWRYLKIRVHPGGTGDATFQVSQKYG